jgi:predicted short-subunit dehydrogenase-like oxidoreductase (DUF2520 family)
MKTIHTISIVGTGNVAIHLGKALLESGITISDVYGRNTSNAKTLADALSCTVTEEIKNVKGDLIIICVKDSAIQEVAELIPSNKLIVHTSGAISMDALNSHDKFGVFYPLQSISKNRIVAFEKIPILLESNDKELLNELDRIAKQISQKTVHLSSDERKTIHLAAVFVNNFVNHLILQSKTIMDSKQLDWQLLLPLLDETINKLKDLGPLEAQTGPARRSDDTTINEHLSLLSGKEKEIYQLLSESIKQTYQL